MTTNGSFREYEAKELRAFARQQRTWKRYCEAKARVDVKFNECIEARQECSNIRHEMRRIKRMAANSGSREFRAEKLRELARRYDEKEKDFQLMNSELALLAQEQERLRDVFREADAAYVLAMQSALRKRNEMPDERRES